jgi:hypothetical protein
MPKIAIISNPVPRICHPPGNAGLGFLQRSLPPYSLNKFLHIHHVPLPVSVPLFTSLSPAACRQVLVCLSRISLIFHTHLVCICTRTYSYVMGRKVTHSCLGWKRWWKKVSIGNLLIHYFGRVNTSDFKMHMLEIFDTDRVAAVP